MASRANRLNEVGRTTFAALKVPNYRRYIAEGRGHMRRRVRERGSHLGRIRAGEPSGEGVWARGVLPRGGRGTL